MLKRLLVFGWMCISVVLVAQSPPHTVYISTQWQDDSGDLAIGATVMINFQRATVSGGPYTTIGAVAATSARRTTYTFIDSSAALKAGVTYYYVAFVSDSNGNTTNVGNEVAVTIPSITTTHKMTVVK